MITPNCYISSNILVTLHKFFKDVEEIDKHEHFLSNFHQTIKIIIIIKLNIFLKTFALKGIGFHVENAYMISFFHPINN